MFPSFSPQEVRTWLPEDREWMKRVKQAQIDAAPEITERQRQKAAKEAESEQWKEGLRR